MHAQHTHELKDGLLRGVVYFLLVSVSLVVSNLAQAAISPQSGTLLFPYYQASEVLNSATAHHYAKDTAALSEELKQLSRVTRQYCNGNSSQTQLKAVKEQSLKTYLSWLELSAVVLGPMLQNNVVRQVDFRPLRLNLLERAIQKQAQGKQDMALVGSPAKGFPAFEYLVQQAQFQPSTPQCKYAEEVVLDISRTIDQLKWQSDFSASDEEDAREVKSELQLYFNQLLGAVHNLTWERMEKPLLKIRDESASISSSKSFSKSAAPSVAQISLMPPGFSEQAWAAQWHGISDLLVMSGQTVPNAKVQVVPIEAYLRGLGKIEIADQLKAHCNKVTAALQASSLQNPSSVQQSVQASKNLKSFLENELAKSMNVAIQFSSSDGD